MPTITDEGKDTRVNPIDENTGQYTAGGIDEAEQYANSGGDDVANGLKHLEEHANEEQSAPEQNTGTPDANVQAAKSQEESSTSDSKDGSSSGGVSSATANLKDLTKKSGPMAIVALIVGLVAAVILVFVSPSLSLVVLMDTISEAQNDAARAMEERSQHIIRAKVRDTTNNRTPLCNKATTIRCKYKTFSKRQLKKFDKAGITVEQSTKRAVNGRFRATGFTFTDSDGVRRTVPAKDFHTEYKKNPAFRSLVNKAYNPFFMSVRDGFMRTKVMTKFKVTTNRIINGRSKAEMKRQMQADIEKGNIGDAYGRKVIVEETTGEDGKTKLEYKVEGSDEPAVFKNGAGEVVRPDPVEIESKLTKFTNSKAGALTKSLGGGALRGANIFTGAQAMACNLVSKLRLAGIVSRTLKYSQLLRYAFTFNNAADQLKSGTLTPETAEFFGDIVTHQDMRKQIVDESTALDNVDINNFGQDGEETEKQKPAIVNNPDYGKDAFDSAGFKAAAYGDAPDMTARQSMASLDGGMGSKLNKLGNELMDRTPGVNEKSCDFFANPIVEGAGVVLSVLSLAVPGAGIAAGGKAMVGIGISVLVNNWIDSQIADLTNGSLFNADAQGMDAGNAAFTGSSAYYNASASGRGMTPLSTKEEREEQNLITARVQKRNAETQTYLARSTPFDVYNKYSFLGSMAFSLTPKLSGATKNMASLFQAPATLLSNATSFINPKANALTRSNPERFNKCTDPVITDSDMLNLEGADIMCNLRFGLNEQQLAADPEKVAQWMIDACQVDPESGEVNTSDKCPDDKAASSPEEYENQAYRSKTPVDLLRITSSEIAAVMKFEDTNVDSAIAQNNTQQEDAKLTADDKIPQSVAANQAYRDNNALHDVRSYAWYLRFCRYGPGSAEDEDSSNAEARTVNFGDPDSLEGNALTGLPIVGSDKITSIGRECLRSNACVKDELGQDKATAQTRCRPAVYDIYEVYTMDKTIEDGLDDEDEPEAAEDSEAKAGDGTGCGGQSLKGKSAQELAKMIMDCDNLQFQTSTQEAEMKEMADRGKIDGCAGDIPMDPTILSYMLMGANEFKVTLGSMYRDHGCDGGFHGKGQAVDINGIVPKDEEFMQSFGTSGAGPYTPEIAKNVTAFEKYIDGQAKKGELGFGQNNCFDAPPLKNGNQFGDTCHHLHMSMGF